MSGSTKALQTLLTSCQALLGMDVKAALGLVNELQCPIDSIFNTSLKFQECLELSKLETQVLIISAVNQLCADQIIPMAQSLEELSLELNREFKEEFNPFLFQQSNLVLRGVLFLNDDQKIRVHAEFLSLLCGKDHPHQNLFPFLIPIRIKRNYAIWNDYQNKLLSKNLKNKRSLTLCYTNDPASDEIEIENIAISQNRSFFTLDLQKIELSSQNQITTELLQRLGSFCVLSNSIIGIELHSESDFNQIKLILDWFYPTHIVLFLNKPNESLYDHTKGEVLELYSEPNYGRLWKNELKSRNIKIDETTLSKVESLFPLSFSKMNRVLDEITLIDESKVTFETIAKACRKQSSKKLEKYAKRLEAKYQWDDLILSPTIKARLSEVYQHVLNRSKVAMDWEFSKKHNRGHGVTIVFEGDSGTGKTMAAEVLAKELGLDLYQVDLSNITSKYVGETEKNLSQIFNAAKDASGILFFDEGEALFSKRSDTQSSQDRYTNLEVNYLLQELESFNGIVIISTNLAQNIDPAFLRRITFQITFVRPDASTRSQIWKTHLSGGLQISEDVDFEFLGELSLTGGIIKNIARQAASWASIRGDQLTMTDVLWGIRREYNKLGIPVAREDFGENYWRHVSPDWEAQFAKKRQEELRPH